jgi:NAD(P)H-hydrate repair Nnr-like enzyme with NAD(P)H-hydrate dehydratase domain
MNYDFWRKQTPEQPLYSDFAWKRPERVQDRGNFLIIGGNKLGFAAVQVAYKAAAEAGAGEIRVLLPDVLSKIVPKQALDAIFLPSNPTGGFSKNGLPQALAAVEWADSLIFVGDTSQNSETALFLEEILEKTDTLCIITRDAIDLLKNSGESLMKRQNTTLAVSFAQLQKLFQAVYYPKMLTFSQNTIQTVENLHKFTLTYPVTIELFHKDMLFLAHGGQVISQKYSAAVNMWTGKLPTKSAVYQIWTNDPLEALAASIIPPIA